MSRLRELHEAGVSIWLDTLSRELLDTGALARLIADFAVTGATSNPTIFAGAITGSDRYDDQLRAAVASGLSDPQDLFFELALEDVGRAADLLRPTLRQRAHRRRRHQHHARGHPARLRRPRQRHPHNWPPNRRRHDTPRAQRRPRPRHHHQRPRSATACDRSATPTAHCSPASTPS
jgi:hypothetical protein